MLSSLKKCVYSHSSNSYFKWFSYGKYHILPDFTKNNYNVTRGSYNTLEENHIQYFTNLLGPRRVIMDVADLEHYNVDWFKSFRGNSSIVLKPKSTLEVSQILSFCNNNRLAVCPQGGNTSVSGGSVPVFDEIIINTELMNEIIRVDEISGVLVCQAGCVLENLNKAVNNKDLTMPLDLGAKGSCHIGGNVSTNAGGLRLLRYGNLHGNILGLEVVKANGEVLDCLNTLKKDNTGYHLKHLFIGSEGTLGFITKVALQCPPKSSSINVGIFGLQSYEKVLKTFNLAKNYLGEILSAVEVVDAVTMQLAKDSLNLHSPIGEYPFHLIIETSGSNEKHDIEKLSEFSELALIKHFVLNGTIASEPSKCQAIWNIRERLPDAGIKDHYIFHFDVTLPLQSYYNLIDELRSYMGNKVKLIYGFGHLGDGNIHVQIAVENYSQEIKNYIESYLYPKVVEMHGSISAEHGMGFSKANYIHLAKSDAAVSLMKDLKNMLDPNKILNPYKVLL